MIATPDIGDHAWAVAIAEVRREVTPASPGHICPTYALIASVASLVRCVDQCPPASSLVAVARRRSGELVLHLAVPALAQAWRASARLWCRSKDALRETMYSCGIAWDVELMTAVRWPLPPRLCL